MNKQIRRLGVFLIMCYLALFLKLNQVQVFQADELNENPLNSRVVQREFNRPRGDIVSADGVVLARSIETPDESFKRLRIYPEGALFAQVTGHFSFIFGSTGVEKEYNEELSGNTLQQQLNGLTQIFSNQTTVGNVEVSLRKDIQTVARDALGPREGSVVALDPRTGEVLAFWSTPSYDPNVLSSANIKATRDAWLALNADPAKPMQAKQYQERYFPGSTFKVVTSGVGLQSGKVTRDEPVYATATAYQPTTANGRPIGKPIANFGGEVCGGSLYEILKFSCNSAYAEMGQKTIGADPDGMLTFVPRWGFNDTPPIDLPGATKSVFPTDVDKDPPKLAQASIGQSDVAATPLEMALVAAGVANGGVILKPHVMKQVTDSDGRVVKTYEPETWLEPMDAGHAATLYEGMLGVVQGGTGTPAQIPGYAVAGKTGTAQLGDGQRTHTWMIAMAGPPGQRPTVAIAVVVLNQGIGGDSTGGQIAGPVAKTVMQAILNVQANQPPPPGSTPAVPGPTTTIGVVPTTPRRQDTPSTPVPSAPTTTGAPVVSTTIAPVTTTSPPPPTTSGAPPPT